MRNWLIKYLIISKNNMILKTAGKSNDNTMNTTTR